MKVTPREGNEGGGTKMNTIIVYNNTMSPCLIASTENVCPPAQLQYLWTEWSLQGATFHRLKPQTEWGTLTGLR